MTSRLAKFHLMMECFYATLDVKRSTFMHFSWAALVAGMLAICFLAGGQEPGKAQKKDSQERFEPRGAPARAKNIFSSMSANSTS